MIIETDANKLKFFLNFNSTYIAHCSVFMIMHARAVRPVVDRGIGLGLGFGLGSSFGLGLGLCQNAKTDRGIGRGLKN